MSRIDHLVLKHLGTYILMLRGKDSGPGICALKQYHGASIQQKHDATYHCLTLSGFGLLLDDHLEVAISKPDWHSAMG